MANRSPTPRGRNAGIYLDAAERIFLSRDTDDGYNMPTKQFHRWWLFTFAGSGTLDKAAVEDVVLALLYGRNRGGQMSQEPSPATLDEVIKDLWFVASLIRLDRPDAAAALDRAATLLSAPPEATQPTQIDAESFTPMPRTAEAETKWLNGEQNWVEFADQLERELFSARSEIARKPTYEAMDAARNEWWSTLSSRGDPARLTSSLGSFSDGFFDGWKAAFQYAASQPNTVESLPASPGEDADQRRAQPLPPDSSAAVAAPCDSPYSRDSARSVAAKIIDDYKEHYSFPNEPQGEFHMYDCIMDALETIPFARGGRERLLAKACDAAFAFIDSHAADPDLTSEMCVKHADYLEARRELEGTP